MIDMMQQRWSICAYIMHAVLICSSWQSFAATVITGDNVIPNQTFSFPLGPVQGSGGTATLFAAAQADAGGQGHVNQFALSRLGQTSNTFSPLAPAHVMINFIPNQPNPLFDSGVAFLDILETNMNMRTEDTPVFVLPQQPNIVYAFENLNEGSTALINTPPLFDFNKMPAAEILALSSDKFAHIFAMVTPMTGTFGMIGSGVAVVVRGFVEAEARENITDTQQLLRFFQQNSVNPLDITSEVFQINADVSHIDARITMYWDTLTQRLFMGFILQGGSAGNDGARGIVVGYMVENNLLALSPIVPATVFTDTTDSIVGALGANSSVSVYNLSTLHTTTALPYLIVNGGIGDPVAAQQTIYALPLVGNNSNPAVVGTIADKNGTPQDIFMQMGGTTKLFVSRALTTPAATPEGMTHATDAAAVVGGGPLTAGEIQSLTTRSDSVYVSVINSTDPEQSGIYYSHALFNQNGTIQTWTTWQRATATTELIGTTALNVGLGTITYTTGTSATDITTVKRTVWGPGDVHELAPFTALSMGALSPINGGVQGTAQFGPNSPGLGQAYVLGMTGNNTIVLGQTATINDNDIAIPTHDAEWDAAVRFNDGTVSADVTDATTVIITGGQLGSIGSLTSMAIATNTSEDNAWLVVAGTEGLVVLAQENGSGWSLTDGLCPNFVGFQAGLRFVSIGGITTVRSLSADNDFLYIATDDTLFRTTVTQMAMAHNNFATMTAIANSATLTDNPRGSLMNIVASGPLALLGTTNQLFATTAGSDIRVDVPSWQPIVLPEGKPNIEYLQTLSTTERPEDIANTGGNVYVVSLDRGKGLFRLNRLSITAIPSGLPVQENTITLFNDLYVQNILSHFWFIGETRNRATTDGAFFVQGTDGPDYQSPAQIFFFPYVPEPRLGMPFLSAHQGNVGITQGTALASILLLYGIGGIGIAGEFGFVVAQ